MAGEGYGDVHNTIDGGSQFGPVVQASNIGNIHFGDLIESVPAPVALDQLPPIVAGFTSRNDELADIASLLDPATSSEVMVVSVAGLPGVGKTALVTQASYLAREAGWFPGGVLFVDMHGYEDVALQPGQALGMLVRALGVSDEHIPPTTEERSSLYRSKLAVLAEPVLVVVDNASSEAQIRPLLPGLGQHRLIITSRHTLGGLSARLIEIKVLDDESGITLLNAALRGARPNDSRISSDHSAASQLARICGGLPLALQICAALLKADSMLTVSELSEDLADEIQRLAGLHYDDGSETEVLSVAAAFELSYRRLGVTAARMFRMLPVNPGPDTSTAAVAALAGVSPAQARKVLSQLRTAHLVDRSMAQDRWRMHDLVRLYASQLSDNYENADGREEARDRLLYYYLEGARAASTHLRALPGNPVSVAFADRTSAVTWLDAERSSLIAAVSAAASTGRDGIAMSLSLALGDYLYRRRLFDDLLAVSMAARTAAVRLGDRRNEGIALINLGVALATLRRFDEAVAAEECAALIYRETGDRIQEAMTLANLAILFRELRLLGESANANWRAMQIYREVGDRRGAAKAISDRGITLMWMRRLDDSIAAQRDAVAIYRAIGDRKGEGSALTNLGAVLREARKFDESLAVLQDSLNISMEIGDLHDEGIALNNLGQVQSAVGLHEKAITAYGRATEIYRALNDLPRMAGALNNLGCAFQSLGRLTDAERVFREAIEISTNIGDRYGQSLALPNLGRVLQELGNPGESLTTLQQSVTLSEEIGDRHSQGTALYHLGLTLSVIGQHAKAVAAQQEAVKIYLETGDRYRQGIALNSLGGASIQMNEWNKAVAAHREAVSIFQETGDRQREADALNNLGLSLGMAGQHDEAIDAFKALIPISQENGNRDGDVVAWNNLGVALVHSGRFSEAATAHEEAARISREIGDEQGAREALANAKALRAAEQ